MGSWKKETFFSAILAKLDALVVDEADVVLESEGSVVLVDGEAEDVRGHLAVALLANVVLPENKLR